MEGAADIRKDLHDEFITEVSSFFYCFFFQFYDFMRTNQHGKKNIFIECLESRFTHKWLKSKTKNNFIFCTSNNFEFFLCNAFNVQQCLSAELSI